LSTAMATLCPYSHLQVTLTCEDGSTRNC